jgi:hypothetical protein
MQTTISVEKKGLCVTHDKKVFGLSSKIFYEHNFTIEHT